MWNAASVLGGIDPQIYRKHFSERELYWWLPPSRDDLERARPDIAHWSYFENWSSYNNYIYARDHVGLQTREQHVSGTYQDFAQNDSILYPLHAYFMYIKFGFGRCTQDVCIDIRHGDMTREEGIRQIEQYDEAYPEEFEERYLAYYNMTKDEFYAIIDKFANKELLEKKNGRWVKKAKLRALLHS